MSPPNAQVLIFEDNELYVEYMRQYLERAGHTVVGSPASIESLEKILPSITADVVLLDNQAPWKAGELPDEKGVGYHAEQLAKKALGENLITVSTTGIDNPGYGDYHFKNKLSENLGDFVTSLPRKER